MDNRWLQHMLANNAATPQHNGAMSIESLYNAPQQTTQAPAAPPLNLNITNGAQPTSDLYGLVRNQAALSPRVPGSDPNDPSSPTQMLLNLLGLAIQPQTGAAVPSPQTALDAARAPHGLQMLADGGSFGDQASLASLLAQNTPRNLTPRTSFTPRNNGADPQQILTERAQPDSSLQPYNELH